MFFNLYPIDNIIDQVSTLWLYEISFIFIIIHVIRLVVDNNIPLKHELFMRITRCFPLLKVLTVYNSKPQWPILNSDANQMIRKTHLLHLTVLSVNYNDLRNVTKNFKNDRTQLNCMIVKQLCIDPNIRLF